MGKMKIANNKKNANGGMPTWLLSLIVGLVALLVIGICLASFFRTTGVFDRMSVAMESEDYSITLPMMKYFYQNAYSSFVSSEAYSYLASQCSLNNAAYGNSGVPLSRQKIGAGQYDSIFVPDIESYKDKTWHDYFMDQATATAKEVLIFCRVADERKISLTEEEKANVELAVKNLAEQIRNTTDSNGSKIYAGLSDNKCFAAAFGNGVKDKDVKAALTLISLAGKASEDLGKEMRDGVTLDRIEKEYSENPKNYEFIDFVTYTYDVKYDAVSKEVLAEIGEDAKEADHGAEILLAYGEEIKKAAEKAKKLSEITDKDEFIKFVINDYVEENYEEKYNTFKTNEKVKDEDAPSSEDEATIKAAMKEAVLKELFAEDAKTTAQDDVDENEDETYSAYGVDGLTKTFGDFLTEFKADFYSTLSAIKSSCVKEKYTYTAPAEDKEEEEYQKWLYDSARKAGDKTLFEEGDGANGEAIKKKDNHYTADVYLMLKPRYKDEDKVRNGASMTFTTKEAAAAAIEALKAKDSLDVETFIEVAKEVEAGNYQELENYTKGTMKSEKFDEWFLDEKRTNGEYTTEPIEVNASSYMVVYFEKEGELLTWQVTVKNKLYNDDFAAATESYTEKYEASVISNDKVLGKVG